MMNIENKAVIITGCSSGVGEATAEIIAGNILYFASDISINTTGQIVTEDYGSSL